MADLSTPEGKLVERLKPAWVIDEPAGEAVSILRRIRGYEPVVDALNRFIVDNNALKSEAADALSRIAAERDEALAALEAERMHNAQLFDEITATELLADVRKVNLEAAERERDELKAEVERLREALMPFAAESSQWEGYEDGEFLVEPFPGITDSKVTVGALRRARAALRTPEESP